MVSKKEAAVPEEDKSNLPSTKEVKVLLTKPDDTRNKTDMENKTEIKVVLQIEDNEEAIEKTDKPKFKCVQKARRGKPISNANRSLDRKTLRDLKRVENIEEPHDFGRKIELKPDYEIDISKLSYEDWLKMEGLNVSSSASSEQNGDVSISKDEESSKSVELIDMENTENAVASEIEVHSNSNLLEFSEDEISEHYANLAMHIIAAFSNEFKSEERVERLKTILKLLEEDKDEVLKCKGGNRNSEKRDIVERECKETERVEAESTEAERVEAERKKKLRGWRQKVQKLRGWRQKVQKLRGWRQKVWKLRGWRQKVRKLRGWRQNVRKMLRQYRQKIQKLRGWRQNVRKMLRQ